MSRDYKVISMILTELRSAKTKDFTLKTALPLFGKQKKYPFDMRPQMDAARQGLQDLEVNTLVFFKQNIDPAQLKRTHMILNT